ncbi:MAG: hypothetical protein NT029_07550 [Armatimonadetes bacterium]|nr:hypothetical protein [Armatimonadota bacterium]
MPRWLTVAAFAALLCAACLAVAAPERKAKPMLHVNGKPALVLGLYENPTDDARLKEAVDAGFNLIQCAAKPDALDRVAAAGAKAWVNLGGDLDLSTDAATRRNRLQATVNTLKAHPALLIWEAPDEALWNCSYGPAGTLEETVYPAMHRAADAQADPAPWKARISRLADLESRGLTDKAQAERQAFWAAIGQPDPAPGVRTDTAFKVSDALAAGMATGSAAVRILDPAHPVWFNHAPRNSMRSLKLFGKAADAVGCDIYPIPFNMVNGHSDLLDTTAASVGAYTDRMRASAPGKLCFMVLQGFGWIDINPAPEKVKDDRIGRRPTWQETRFMAYDALLHGADALMWWGTAYAFDNKEDGTKDLNTALWRDLLRIARELRALEPLLVAPAAAPGPKFTLEENPSSHDGAGLVSTLRQAGGRTLLIVANERGTGRAFTVSGLPAALEGKTLYRLGTSESVTVRSGAFRDGVRGWDVHVYAGSRDLEP